MTYINMDLNGDGLSDGVFMEANYGHYLSEGFLVADDGTVLKSAVPDGLPGDITNPNEVNRKAVTSSQTSAGFVFDWNFAGSNELVMINSQGSHQLSTLNVATTNNGEVNRGHTGISAPNIDLSMDYVPWRQLGQELPGSGSWGYRANNGGPMWSDRSDLFAFDRFGRTRSGLTEDFNLDGLPDIMMAQDTDLTGFGINMPETCHRGTSRF